GLHRAGLLAGCPDLAVPDRPVFLLCGDPRRVDPLDAVGAFFHHASLPHGDVGILLKVDRGVLLGSVVQEIEATHLVRAVVRAVARADAPVVDHLVQAFTAVDRRTHRAHKLAGRVLAVHTRYRLAEHARVCGITVKVLIDSYPVHLSPPGDLILPDRRYVVFGLARRDAGVAAEARAKVDRHAPGVLPRLPL